MVFIAPNSNDLMERYIDVCNQALALNKNRFPFKQILGAAQKSECGKIIEVYVSPGLPKKLCAISLGNDGKLRVTPHSSFSDLKGERKWVVKKTYLEDVVKDPEAYIQNPAKINWDWMYDCSTR